MTGLADADSLWREFAAYWHNVFAFGRPGIHGVGKTACSTKTKCISLCQPSTYHLIRDMACTVSYEILFFWYLYCLSGNLSWLC